MAARHTHPQVDPIVANGETLFASICYRRDRSDCVNVCTFWFHTTFISKCLAMDCQTEPRCAVC
jgi:hypothetical protein